MSICLDHITIIAVEPQTPGNVGSICRACKNMGISNIVLVNPAPYLVDETFRFGWGSEDLIRSIRVVETLADIAAELDITIGTTQRKRENQVPLYTPREIVDEISPYETAKIGFVFGRENNGLSNDELSSCNYQSTIPSAVSYPALNLSQAVMVYAHELYLASTRITPVYDWTLASKSDQERLYTMIHDAVETLPFKTRNGTAAFVNLFRRVLGRTKIEARDIRVLYKLFDLIKRK